MFRAPSCLVAAVAAAAISANATPVSFDLADFSVDVNGAKLGPNGTAVRTRSVGWNLEENVGGFVAGTGFRIGGATHGSASMIFDYTLKDMLTTLDWDGHSSVKIEQLDSRTYNISAGLARNSGSTLSTSGLKYGAGATFAINAFEAFQAKGCASGFCDSAGTTRRLLASQELLRAGNIGSTPLSILGTNTQHPYGTPYVISAGVCDLPAYTVGVEIGRITAFNPGFAASTQTGSGSGLDVTARARTVSASLDLDAILSGLFALPQPSLRVEAGPIAAQVDLYDLKATLGLDIAARQSFSAGERQNYVFDRPVQATQITRTASFLPNVVLGPGSTCGTVRDRTPAGSFPTSLSATRFGSVPPVLAVQASPFARCYHIEDSAHLAPVKAGELISLASDEVLTVKSETPFNVSVSTELAPVVETGIDLDIVGSFDLDILKAAADYGVAFKQVGPVFSGSLPLFDLPIPLYAGRNYLNHQTCGQRFGISGASIAVVEDSFFCGGAAPGTSFETVPLPEDAAIDIPPLTLVGGPFEVPEPAGTLPLLAILTVFGALTLQRRVTPGSAT